MQLCAYPLEAQRVCGCTKVKKGETFRATFSILMHPSGKKLRNKLKKDKEIFQDGNKEC